MLEETKSVKTIFELGQKVFDIRCGWGVVREIKEGSVTYPVVVDFFSEQSQYTLDGKSYEDDNESMLRTYEYKLCEVKLQNGNNKVNRHSKKT